jgi:hypothetical protein
MPIMELRSGKRIISRRGSVEVGQIQEVGMSKGTSMRKEKKKPKKKS